MQDDVDGGNGSLLVGAVGHFYFAQIGHFYFAATWRMRGGEWGLTGNYGNQRTWLRKSSGAQVSHTIQSPSMAAPVERDDGMRSTPGDSRSAMNSWKWTRIVRTSRATRTRPASAATRRTSAAGVPSGIMSAECRKSREGSVRRKPLPMSGPRSASA